MKRFVLFFLVSLGLAVLLGSSLIGTALAAKEEVWVSGKVGFFGTRVKSFYVVQGSKLSFEANDPAVNDVIQRYCKPRCAMLIITDTDTGYIEKVLSIQSLED